MPVEVKSEGDRERMLREFASLRRDLRIPEPVEVDHSVHTRLLTGIKEEDIRTLHEHTTALQESNAINRARSDAKMREKANRYLQLKEMLEPSR
jgi:hypothetical protein